MKDFLDKLKGMDKKQLAEAMQQAKAFAATPEGKEFVEKVKKGEAGIDKAQQENLAKQLSKNPDIAKTIFDILKG
jgi:high-affinity K+ transport system ATPase subunit B